MAEFASLTTKLVTPLLKQRGFKKHGSFGRGELADSATFRRGNLVLELLFSSHPCDYPEVGIRMRVSDANGILFDRLHPPIGNGLEAIFRAVANDIESGVGGV